MNILYMILKHVVWRFRIYNSFREIVEFREILKVPFKDYRWLGGGGGGGAPRATSAFYYVKLCNQNCQKLQTNFFYGFLD